MLGIDVSSHNFEERKIVLNRGWWGHHQCFDNLVTGSNSIRHDKLNLNEETVITLFHTKMFSCILVLPIIPKHLKGSDRELIL